MMSSACGYRVPMLPTTGAGRGEAWSERAFESKTNRPSESVFTAGRRILRSKAPYRPG